MSRQAPALATTILERSGVDPVLIGDLVEQYRGGRSALWLWSQVPRAVVNAAIRDVRRHYILAARALLVANACTRVLNPITYFLNHPVGVTTNNWLLESG